MLLQTLCVLELESRLSHAATLGDGNVNKNFRKSHIINANVSHSVDVAEYGNSMVSGPTKSFYQRYLSHKASSTGEFATFSSDGSPAFALSTVDICLDKTTANENTVSTDPVHVGFPLYTHLNDSVRSNNISVVSTTSIFADQKCAKIITRLPLGWQHHLLNLQRDYLHTMLAVAEQAVGSMQVCLGIHS